jgi:hypothetical protein
MISCYFKGGLGNQLFQIATAFAFSKDVNDDFGIDLSQGHFTQKTASCYSDNVFKNIKKINFKTAGFTSQYSEPYYHYTKIPPIKNILLNGFFQSAKYFENYYNDICNLLINKGIVDKLKNNYILENSLSLHIRRGDYLLKANFHFNQSLLYYFDAIKYVDLIEKIDRIYVFSDDISWCKENFTDDRIIFVENIEDYEQLYLMSLCNHNIIANSSFSWWGSYLNTNSNKIVIAPKNWYGREFGGNWQDVYYKNNVIL